MKGFKNSVNKNKSKTPGYNIQNFDKQCSYKISISSKAKRLLCGSELAVSNLKKTKFSLNYTLRIEVLEIQNPVFTLVKTFFISLH